MRLLADLGLISVGIKVWDLSLVELERVWFEINITFFGLNFFFRYARIFERDQARVIKFYLGTRSHHLRLKEMCEVVEIDSGASEIKTTYRWELRWNKTKDK
jgi:hypothetical protein